MATSKRPERPRTKRRAQARTLDKLTAERERLFLLERGATPQRPIEIATPALVELKATALACPRCLTAFRIEAHRAAKVAGLRLREAEVSCPRCHVRRSLWFELEGTCLS
jgi:hypothetical protein